jgi:hypothetical protein
MYSLSHPLESESNAPLFHGLFNDAVNSSDYVASNYMINEVVRIWKEAVVA